MNVANSTPQRIPKSKLRSMNMIADYEEAPGRLYEGELDGTRVIIKCYRRRKGVWNTTEKVTRRLFIRLFYLTVGVPYKDWWGAVKVHHQIMLARRLPFPYGACLLTRTVQAPALL
jgi:hypothetical protein